MVTAESVRRGRRTALNRRAMQFGDIFFLLVAVLVADLNAPVSLFSFLALLSGLLVWMAIGAPPHRLRRIASRRLAAPLLAALLTLFISASLREPYSGSQLAIFTVVWTAGMLLLRLTVPKLLPPLRVLLIARSDAFQELLRNPWLSVDLRATPPKQEVWDVIAVESHQKLEPDVIRWLNGAAVTGYTVVPAHELYEEFSGKIAVDVLEGRWVAGGISRAPGYTTLKRVLDVCAVLLLLPILLPLSAVVALIVYIDCGRPILFWQDRVGYAGAPFRMVKFRTMHEDAEADGAAFATDGDGRVTKAGKFLRKFRLDELPQFWNVLRGEMSIIGPRPEQVPFAKEFEESLPLYGLRHSVLPGITGWAQVTQGYAADADATLEKLRRDMYYIKHRSLFLDARVLLMTLITVMTGFGAR